MLTLDDPSPWLAVFGRAHVVLLHSPLALLPAMAVLGYVVAGMWLGELIVGQLSTTPRERPYLAAVSGLSVLGLAAVLPVVGGLASLAGFGAITLGLWRAFRGEPAASVRMTQVAAPSAG